MPKVPYKPEKSGENEDDYEIVSFEDFCDKSPGSKTDLLTLNDNINYRLCFESDKVKYSEGLGESSQEQQVDNQTETSLSGSKGANFKRRLSNSFAPFGKYTGKGTRPPLFSGVIPKPRNEDDGATSSRDHRYQRFSGHRNLFQRMWERVPGMGSGVMGIALVCAVCVAVWWAVSGAVGGAWADEHYKKLWERAHPETVKAPISPLQLEKASTEHRYHDHNNLSTKNRNNSTDKKAGFKKHHGERTPEEMAAVCRQTNHLMKFDCYPTEGATQEACLKRGCCWSQVAPGGEPACFYPPQYNSHRFINMTEDKHSLTVFYERDRPSGYPGDFRLVRMDFKYMSDDVLQIKIYDAENKRFEPPYPEISIVPKPLVNPKYRVIVEGSAIGFKIVRTDDNITIFNAQDVGGLILSDKFLQLSAILSSEHLYGLGEKRERFQNNMKWNRFAIFNRDRMPTEGMNLYGSHPFYLGVENNGKSHGTLLLNSNAMDIVLQETPAITYRTIGGILHFMLMLGPSPAAVVQQYTEIIGRPFMPPYWALGFHLCRFNYGSLEATKAVWKANRDAGIPFDVQWNDIDYMKDHDDFTINDNFTKLGDFVHELQSVGMHYMMIVDPGVAASEQEGTYLPYIRGLEMDVFVKNSTNQPFVGQVWNKGRTVFPDFTHPNATAYWTEMLRTFHNQVPFDGVWIDMNEPSNFLDGPAYGTCAPEDVPYRPRTGDPMLRTHTLCMDARHYAADHYHVHNLYAITEAIATHQAVIEIRRSRPMVISRASSPGLGAVSGHWSGDVRSDWHDMQMTIPELLSFSLYGIPMMGADICGFAGDTTPELCKRWMQLGAFYPFSRNHNDDKSIPQDPASLGGEVLSASRVALRRRYALLPLYYTCFWAAATRGDTVARPLFFESPDQTDLFEIDNQFLIGANVMITPILYAGMTSVQAYYPPPEPWYLWNGTTVRPGDRAEVDEHNTVAFRGGGIIPMQEPASAGPVTTRDARSRPFQLVVAPRADRTAHGELYWDDGHSINSYQEKRYSHIEFCLNGTVLYSNTTWWGFGAPPVNQISFLDTPRVKNVNVNGVTCHCDIAYYAQNNTCLVKVNLTLDKPFRVELFYEDSLRENFG